jgi:hypothetical protein
MRVRRKFPNEFKYQILGEFPSGTLTTAEICRKAVTKINQVWLADITYIRFLHEYIYLSAILDYYPSKAISYRLFQNIDTQLTLNALFMAIERRKPKVGVIRHSEQGGIIIPKNI